MIRHTALVFSAAALLSATASAHTGIGSSSDLVAGLVHPWLGLDHVVSMLAVGLWAGQRGGRWTWSLPVAFLAFMTLGGVLGALRWQLPLVEPGIATFVLLLGVLIAANARLPRFPGVLLVGICAILHGHAHGEEMTATAGMLAFSSGFLASTAALLASGVAISLALRGAGRESLLRWTGATVVASGLLLLA